MAPSAEPEPYDRDSLTEPAAGGSAAVLMGRAGTPAQGRELRARGRRTLRKLLDAGVEVFAKRGYHAARVDDVVKAAKTSHGTFYLYFSNKEDLFRALALDVAEEMTELANRLGTIGPTDEGYAELRDWLDRFMTLYEHYGPVIQAWTEAGTDSREFFRLGTQVLGGFAQVLAERIRTGGAKDIDPDIAALALVSMIERFNYFAYYARLGFDRDATLDTLTSIIHAGLFAGPHRPARGARKR